MVMRATLWQEVGVGRLTQKHQAHAEGGRGCRIQRGSLSCPLALSVLSSPSGVLLLLQRAVLLQLTETKPDRLGERFPAFLQDRWLLVGRDCGFNTSLHKAKISSNWIIVRREDKNICLFPIPQGVSTGSSCPKAKSWQRMGRWAARTGAS